MAGPVEARGLAPESDSLTPLPPVLRSGLTAVTVLACISFVSSAIVLFYLTYKLGRWHFKSGNGTGHGEPQGVDLSLGLSESHFENRTTGVGRQRPERGKQRPKPNQFLILIFNLLVADMQQSAAFLLNASWLSADSIRVGTRTCFAQGWLISVGDLSSSLFISSIAVHTYMTVVRGYKPPQWALYAYIAFMWIFVHLVSTVGLIVTKNGRNDGGYYVRAAAWCWMNVKYEKLRLVTHYLFIFMSLALTTILYTLIFLSLRKTQAQLQPEPGLTQRPRRSKSLRSKPSVDMRGGVQLNATNSGDTVFENSGGRHPAFLIYPVIYVVCTAPLALGRIATMAGVHVPLEFFCAAGALITSNGWLDVVLFGVTRRWLLFRADIDTEDAGIGTFAFMRTPHDRKYGNMVWVQGPQSREDAVTPEAGDGWSLGWVKKLMGWRRLGFRSRGRPAGRTGGASGKHARRRNETNSSQESLRGATAGIQMDLVTTVVVEVDKRNEGQAGRPYGEASASSMSVHSTDKDLHHPRL